MDVYTRPATRTPRRRRQELPAGQPSWQGQLLQTGRPTKLPGRPRWLPHLLLAAWLRRRGLAANRPAYES
jgi:hypothetical protein